MRLLPYGDAALLLEVDGLDDVLMWTEAVASAAIPGVLDIVPAAQTVLIRCDPGTLSVATLATTVSTLEPRPGQRPQAANVTIPVTYDGADLDEVGRLTGLGARGVVEAHTGQAWTVAFGGFAPGFAYLVGENEKLAVPRREVPRTAVPPGAVGLAAEYTGIYPRSSPGGWQLIGHTETTLWDVEHYPPALLTVGTIVCFVEA